MNIRNYKCYVPFIVSIMLFAITLFWFVSPQISKNGVIDEELQLEIKLPVIEWNKYTNLSKQYDLSKIDKVNLINFIPNNS